MREIYLDNGATTFPKPECVYRAIDAFLRTCGGSHGRGAHKKARETDEMVARARQALARLFRVPEPSRLILTANATESLNLALKGLLLPGDHAILTDLEHNAVLRPLWKLKKKLGIDLTIMESSEHGILEPQRINEAIRDRTRLICCVHVNNVLGTIQPVAEVGEVARKRRIPLLVDAAQSAGVVQIDVEGMGIDLLAFTGHKGLLGPQGTGGLYIREGIEPEPLKEGGTGLNSESPDPPASVPEQYEAGTANAVGIAGLGAGVEFIEREGIDAIRSHETALNRRFMEGLEGSRGIRVYGPPDPEKKVGVTLINFEGLSPADAASLLDRRFGVMVRHGLQCSALTHRKLGTEGKGAVRFSFGYFNTVEDVDHALDAVRQITMAVR